MTPQEKLAELTKLREAAGGWTPSWEGRSWEAVKAHVHLAAQASVYAYSVEQLGAALLKMLAVHDSDTPLHTEARKALDTIPPVEEE